MLNEVITVGPRSDSPGVPIRRGGEASPRALPRERPCENTAGGRPPVSPEQSSPQTPGCQQPDLGLCSLQTREE